MKDGLTFKLEVGDATFNVKGILEGQEYSLANGAIVSYMGHKRFDIDNFFFMKSDFNSPYYKPANDIAKAHGRTLPGIVMEVIKSAMAEGDYVRITADAWLGSRGKTLLKSWNLRAAAKSMLGEGDVEDAPWWLEEYDSDDAKAYLEKRYRRLFPTESIPRDEFLRNTFTRGWYGAWLPMPYTEKKDFITTAVRP